MNAVLLRAAKVVLSGVLTFAWCHLYADLHSGRVLVESVEGEVSFSTDNIKWQSLKNNAKLDRGTLIKTGADSTADLVLGYNGTVVRLTQNSILRLAKLDQEIAGEDVITETKLELLQGALAGSQRKLTAPSSLEIITSKAVARIKGTEYYVRSDGAVSVISGEVTMNYNVPGNQGSIRVSIPAGYTFDPVSQTVVPTNAAYLQNIIAHVDTTRRNAETYKVQRALIVVKPEGGDISPHIPKGNNGVGNGVDPQPPGNPPINDGPGTGPGNPGNKGGAK